jgi:hypothetical protein
LLEASVLGGGPGRLSMFSMPNVAYFKTPYAVAGPGLGPADHCCAGRPCG